MQECLPRRADATCRDLPRSESYQHQSEEAQDQLKEDKPGSRLLRASPKNQVLGCRPTRCLVATLGKGLRLLLGRYSRDSRGFLAQSPSERAPQSKLARSGHPHTKPLL